MPGLVHGQPSRFATVLFYLNDDMEGGETSFPRWLNAETSQALKVKPERGKAILFYNMLPDGNYDERSQHAALPVTKGEKVRSIGPSVRTVAFAVVDAISCCHLSFAILVLDESVGLGPSVGSVSWHCKRDASYKRHTRHYRSRFWSKPNV
jgi:2OG-Fe(II) oxygenase superfamily